MRVTVRFDQALNIMAEVQEPPHVKGQVPSEDLSLDDAVIVCLGELFKIDFVEPIQERFRESLPPAD